MSSSLTLSPLAHTWVFDIDGTVVKHNGHEDGGLEVPLPGVVDFLRSIPEKDTVIFLTARSRDYARATEAVLDRSGIRYDHIIYDVPSGERILVNDCKPSGLKCAVAVNLTRDAFDMPRLIIDENL